jgi:bla regulator protein BlaR1
MSPEQQKESSVSVFESPVPVKKTPSPELFEKWKNPQVFGVWINGKKVNNRELENYKYSDIVETQISKLYGKAKTSVTYKYQLELTTNDLFDKTYDERMRDRISLWQRIAMK